MLVLIGLGADNERRALPRLRAAAASGDSPGAVGLALRRSLREVALLAVVLGVTSVLVVSYAPPTSANTGPVLHHTGGRSCRPRLTPPSSAARIPLLPGPRWCLKSRRHQLRIRLHASQQEHRAHRRPRRQTHDVVPAADFTGGELIGARRSRTRPNDSQGPDQVTTTRRRAGDQRRSSPAISGPCLRSRSLQRPWPTSPPSSPRRGACGGSRDWTCECRTSRRTRREHQAGHAVPGRIRRRLLRARSGLGRESEDGEGADADRVGGC